MPTREQLLARIAELEAATAKPAHRSPKRTKKLSPDKARKAQFKLDAWRRAHLHTTLNRYSVGR